MNPLFFDRETGALGSRAFAKFQLTKDLNSLQLSNTRFDGGERRRVQNYDENAASRQAADGDAVWASKAGVNALAVDKFEGRLMLSGGADGSIRLWNLDNGHKTSRSNVFQPERTLPRGSTAHDFGITALNFYPSDSGSFLSSSYDHSLKVFATESCSVRESFNLNAIIYCHAISPRASHRLIACATQHPRVRLVDLRSGSDVQSLFGHQAALLSIAWCPTKDHILASGDTTGIVRLWDVRSSAACLGALDLEDSVGITGQNDLDPGSGTRDSGKAHTGAANGISWTGDGNYLVTAGHDQRVRVWDMMSGRNTLASFGPNLRNSHLSAIPLLIPPTLTSASQTTLFYPNGHEILQFNLHEGRLQRRLKIPGQANGRKDVAEDIAQKRVTSAVWRVTDNELYSAHSDGKIRAWLPETAENDFEDDQDQDQPDTKDGDSKKRKRQVLDEVFRDLTGRSVTFN